MSVATPSKPRMIDPLRFAELHWPEAHFYDKQRQIIYSVLDNDETVCPAGNALGKDYVSAFIALYFFLSRRQCRIVTTSVKDDHLRVLWGEINNFIQTSKLPLNAKDGGPLIVNHHEIKKLYKGSIEPKSYLIGMVAAEGAALQGHHLPRNYYVDSSGRHKLIPNTLFIVDEASGVDDEYHKMASTWAHRMLIIGNPWACHNFFYHAVKGTPGTDDRGGDLPRISGEGYYRKLVQMAGTDSPNVRLAFAEMAAGREPSGRIITPGVLSYEDYVKRRALWSATRQCVSLDGRFYEGPAEHMFPEMWLDRAERIAMGLAGQRRGRAIGVDPAEGGDSSCWSVVDDSGLVALISEKTPDTTRITDITIRLLKIYGTEPKDVWFDRGGGGKEHVDRLRRAGYNVQSVAFGEAASDVDRFATWKKSKGRKVDDYEGKTVYKNRRAEMYGILRQLIDPVEEGFGLPREFVELRRQLAPIPLRYGREGVMYLLPKHKDKADSNEENLTDLLGCSPDEADSLALAVFGLMEARTAKPYVGALEIEV